MKKLLLVRPFANVMNIKNYNSQEIGLCKAFCKCGYDCDIIYYSTENRSEQIFYNGKSRVKLIWKKGIKFGTMAIYLDYLNPIKLKKYDIIISNEYNQIMSILLAFVHPNVHIYHGPYFNTFQSIRQMRLYDSIGVAICNKFVRTIFAKTDDAAQFLQKKGIKRVITVGVGLDIDRFKNETGYVAQDDKNNNILYVGTDEQRKRIGYIMKVFQALCNERENLYLTIVGDINRNRKKQLLSLVKAQYRKQIKFMGKIENEKMADIYRNAACSVLASDQEIFGMVVLESMYFQTPCVAHSVAGPKTVIEDHVDGILEDNYDLTCWKEDIKYLLYNTELREHMGIEARKKVLQCFTWDKVAYKMINRIRKDDQYEKRNDNNSVGSDRSSSGGSSNVEDEGKK